MTADLHPLKLLDWFRVSHLFALPAEGGDVTNDPGAVLAQAEADHSAALQSPAARLTWLAPAGLSVVTRGGEAPGETGGEITQRGAWAQINFNVLKIRLKHNTFKLFRSS